MMFTLFSKRVRRTNLRSPQLSRLQIAIHSKCWEMDSSSGNSCERASEMYPSCVIRRQLRHAAKLMIIERKRPNSPENTSRNQIIDRAAQRSSSCVSVCFDDCCFHCCWRRYKLYQTIFLCVCVCIYMSTKTTSWAPKAAPASWLQLQLATRDNCCPRTLCLSMVFARSLSATKSSCKFA